MSALSNRIKRIEKQHTIEPQFYWITYANPETHAEALERFTYEVKDFNPHFHKYDFLCLNDSYWDYSPEDQISCNNVISIFHKRYKTYQAIKRDSL